MYDGVVSCISVDAFGEIRSILSSSAAAWPFIPIATQPENMRKKDEKEDEEEYISRASSAPRDSYNHNHLLSQTIIAIAAPIQLHFAIALAASHAHTTSSNPSLQKSPPHFLP